MAILAPPDFDNSTYCIIFAPTFLTTSNIFSIAVHNSCTFLIFHFLKIIQITNWASYGAPGLYNAGSDPDSGFNDESGDYLAPKGGVYYCAAQVVIATPAGVTASSGFFRIALAVHGTVREGNGLTASKTVSGQCLFL